MPLTPSPDAPQRNDPATFSDKGDALMAWLPTMVTEANALEANVEAKEASAVAAEAAAAASALDAATSATEADASRVAADAASAAARWVSGTTYAEGVVTYSPIDWQAYRRIVAGAGTTDPSLDLVNWIRVGAVAEVRYLELTANATLTRQHKGRRIRCIGDIDVGFDPAATLGDGWYAFVEAYPTIPAQKQTITTGPTLGADLVVNGGFATDTVWNKGTGWTISGGVAVGTATTGTLRQTGILTVGTLYKITFDLVVTSGTITLTRPDAVVETLSQSGSYVVWAVAAITDIEFDALTAFTGTIDNVTVQAVSTIALGAALTAGAEYSLDCSIVRDDRFALINADVAGLTDYPFILDAGGQAIGALVHRGNQQHALRFVASAAHTTVGVVLPKGVFWGDFADTVVVERVSPGIAIAAASGEEIDGLAGYAMYPREVRLIHCDGIELRSVVLNAFERSIYASESFTPAPGYSALDARLWGGGGSGCKSTSSLLCAGTGGAGGGYAEARLPVRDLPVPVPVVVGAGGPAAAVSGNGSAGGYSAFGPLQAGGGSAGSTNSTAPGGPGFVQHRAGVSFSFAASHVLGPSVTTHTVDSVAFYGGGSGTSSQSSNMGLYGGLTIYGGAHGGGYAAAPGTYTMGLSIFGGCGGATLLLSASHKGLDGPCPGAGGGVSGSGWGNSGKGGDGRVDVRGVI